MSTLDNLTLREIKELSALFNKSNPTEHFFQIGKAYFIRTVTMHLIGKLEAVGEKELLMSQASQIADSGRFHEAIKTGKLDEVEPFKDDIIIGRGAIVDATEWTLDVPKEVKQNESGIFARRF